MTDKYTLNEKGNPVPEPDLLTWANWFEHANTVVKQEFVGDVRVSTIFLGLDMNWGTGGTPVLWETAAFLPKQKGPKVINRCGGTREQAEAMHAEMVSEVKNGKL